MTTTIKVVKTEMHESGAIILLGILADGKCVGEATLTRYYDEDGNTEYAHLENIGVYEDYRGKGYGAEAIMAMCKAFGRIVAAPDSEDSRRLFERIGELVEDVGFGIYEIR